MRSVLLKKIALVLSTITFVAVSSLATAETPWGPRQRQRHHEVRRLNHHIDHQYQQAARAANHGHWWDAMWHWNHAQQMQQHRNAVQHQIHHANRRWEHNHDDCLRHHLYC